MFLATARIALAFFLYSCIATAGAPAVYAQSVVAGDATIEGTIRDAQTGLGLPGVSILAVGRELATLSAGDGRFHLDHVPPGIYTLRATLSGYAPADTEALVVGSGAEVNVTLALTSAPTAQRLKTIGSTLATSAGNLQKSSTIYRSLSPEVLQEAGTFRAGDALRALPGVNNGITGDTGSLGDDLNLDLRGIGVLETEASLDGHPIAYGVPGGYNYQLSPIFGLRAINVTYGSGSNLSGTSAIGGIVDFDTLDPTPDRRLTVAQSYGTFDKASTNLSLTGTTPGRLGYAFSAGVGSLDGPIKNSFMYQPGAAFDQSATDPAVHDLGIYKDDSAVVSRSGLGKLRYAFSSTSSLTLTMVASSYWEDKTGNGDGDFTDFTPELAFGNLLLSQYKPSNFPKLAACPNGEFVATNANGVPNGTGPSGLPDGGSACQTPAQFAANNAGLDGAGPAWESFNFDDEHLGFTSTPSHQLIRADVYADRYLDTVNRQAELPTPGSLKLTRDAEGGASVSDTYLGKNNDIGIGYSYINVAYNIATTSSTSTSIGAPIVDERGFVLHDIYHPENAPETAYFDANLKYATATATTSFDPRASLVDIVTPHNVLRLSAGATTTQPAGNELDQPFHESEPGGAGGGAAITCAALNSIGSTPSSALKPERGVDEEIAYGHEFSGDSQAQLSLYNDNVYDKLFSTLVPLSQTGSGFINPAYLSQVTSTVAALCGAGAPQLLGLNGTFNVGQLRARGFLLNGRQRLDRSTFIDYDWTLDSTVLVSAPTALLQSNVALIPGAQLAHLPLHTLDLALDHVLRHGFEARYSIHTVSANNTKSLPAYSYSDLHLNAPFGPGTFSLGVTNLFNRDADIFGLRFEGVPLALNSFATAAAYAPFTGAAATERFGLPYRMITFSYLLRAR